MALKYPDILQSNNPAAYGIVPATEVSGHKQVANLTALYALADPILSLSGTNTNNDAIGQLWYVASEGKHYQLVDWANRNNVNGNGWKVFKSGGGSKNIPFNGFISIAIEEEIKQSTDSPAEVYYYTVDGIFIAQDNDGNSYYEWEETAEFPSSEEYGDYEGGVSAVNDRNYINLSNGQLYIYDPNHNTSALSRAVRPRVAYGTCSTAANVAEKIVTLHDDFKDWRLEVGAEVVIKFTIYNTANAMTLNVNGTGAKRVFYGGTILEAQNSNITPVNVPVRYMFDGTYFVWMGYAKDRDTTCSPHTLGFGYGICETAAATATKTATLTSYTLVKNGIVSVKFTNSVPASATLNINSKGAKPIYYRGSTIVAGVINAGDVATFIYDGTNYIYLGTDNALSKAGGTMTGNLIMTSDGTISVLTDEDSSHSAVMGVDKTTDTSYMQADTIKKIGGTSDQVLLADGSVAGTITTAWLEANLT